MLVVLLDVTLPASGADLAREFSLTKVGGRPPLGTYLRQIWDRRHFARNLARAKAYTQNQGGYLGQAWVILTPVLWAVLYYFVFGVLLKRVSDDIHDYATFLVVGIFTIRYLSGTLSHAARSLERSNNLITSLQFPRALIPIASALSDLYQFLPAVGVLFGVALANGEPVRPHLLLFVPAMVLCFGFATGISFFASRLVAMVSDLGELIPFFNRALFYTSGVFFSLDRYGEGWVGAVMKHQPFAIYLELNRSALVEEIPIEASTWLWGAFWAVLTLGTGFVFFWRAEARYGRG
ncbi:putative ABC-type polysaccharide/polyol phosphate export system, permease component [metagenome]|uniref:Putative ABC-type polysaccharide/polyol phosphate export system, permease component n=1 Tax=metagenome TaxID=256318 RepID=A0A2P2CAH2_9ZZZZ